MENPNAMRDGSGKTNQGVTYDMLVYILKHVLFIDDIRLHAIIHTVEKTTIYVYIKWINVQT